MMAEAALTPPPAGPPPAQASAPPPDDPGAVRLAIDHRPDGTALVTLDVRGGDAEWMAGTVGFVTDQGGLRAIADRFAAEGGSGFHRTGSAAR